MLKEASQAPSRGSLQEYNTQRILNSDMHIVPLNVKLTSNPFLKDQEKFHFLVYKLNDYNKRIAKQEITDPFEVMVFERLHSVVCDLAYIFTKEDMITVLDETLNWFKEQEKMITQRKDQGEVRYEVKKEVRNGVEVVVRERAVSQKTEPEEIPSQTVARASRPFRRGWRTAHKEIDIPIRRLNEYKRKILNIAPFIEPKEEKKAPTIIYPKIPRFEPRVDEPDEAEGNVEGQEINPPAQLGPDGQVLEQAPQVKEEQNPQDQQQDLGGFGEEPAEPEEEQPPEDEGGDKLAPKLKSFTLEYRSMKRKQYKGPYQFYKGEEQEPERRMEQRYLRIYQRHLQKQKQDSASLSYLDQWASQKGKLEKEWQKTLQNGAFQSNYSLSLETPPDKEMLNHADELKFGFTENLRFKPKYAEFNMSDTKLPSINNQENSLYEKSIRKDRLKSLKNRFSKLLNLKDFEERETANSICQYSSRKRGLSEVIRNHSQSKERLNQLDQVTRIKEKLARSKVGVDIRSLSMGLCAPEQQEKSEVFLVPGKDLPSNPFMVETKKKKKKK